MPDSSLGDQASPGNPSRILPLRNATFGAFHLTGKDAYDKAIDGPSELVGPPHLEVVRMVEQDDVVMAELTGTVKRAAGGGMRMSRAEVFVMRDGKISERRAGSSD